MTDEDKIVDLPKDRLWQPVTARWFYVVFGASLAYAVVRYHVAGNVSWSHFPLFILNKATSLAAVIFVASSYLVRKIFRWHQRDPHLQLVVIKFCGLAGFSLAAIHVLMSFGLLTPAYFAKFFEVDGRLNLSGEAGISVGALALWALAMPGITTLPMMPKALGGFRWKRSQRMGYLSLSLVFAHMVCFGITGWFSPQKWPWNLPPIKQCHLVPRHSGFEGFKQRHAGAEV